ncbi:MAG: transglutaminase family protein [Oscillospiraceae bacterium]
MEIHKKKTALPVDELSVYLRAAAVFMCASLFAMSALGGFSVLFLVYGLLFIFADALSEKLGKPVLRLIPAAMAVLPALISPTSLSRRLAIVCNSCLTEFFARYKCNVTLFKVGGEVGLLSVCFFSACFAMLIIAAVREGRLNRCIRAALTFSLTAFAAVFANSPLSAALAAFAAAALWFKANRRNIVIPLVIAAFSAVFFNASGRIFTAAEEHLYSNSAEKAPNGKITFAMPSGESPALEITLKDPEPVYLHGFLGYEYRDGVWSEPNFSTATVEINGFSCLAAAEVDYSVQAARLVDSEPNHITVRNIGADKRWEYLPYSINSGAKDNNYPAALENKRTLFDGGEVVSVDFLSGSCIYDDTFFDNYKPAESAEYALLDRICKEKFTENPENIERILTAQLENYHCKTGDLNAAANVIYSYLGGFEYDRTASGVTAEDFLQQTKSGSSAHFATAAVMIFRHYGIAARYAEGYAADFEAVGQALSGSPITLTQADFHAWAEYYLEGVGWLPFEATPEYFDRMPLPEGVSVGSSESANSSQTPSAEPAEEFSGERLSKTIVERPDETVGRFPAAAVICVLVAVIIFRALYVRHKLKTDSLFALKRCAKLLGAELDSGGSYCFDMVECKDMKEQLYNIQDEYITEYYTHKTDKNTNTDSLKIYKMCLDYLCKSKNLYRKIALYIKQLL